jgi:[ribosomal protein S18]-alanine N-acetyltransferase
MTPEEMAELHRAAFTQDRPWTASEFASLLDSPHTHLTTRTGGFALWRSVGGEAELLTIAVEPTRQGTGIGTALMNTWMECAQNSADTAFLEVASDNATACALYARSGFDVVARRAAYYKQPTGPADALVMRARLPVLVGNTPPAG